MLKGIPLEHCLMHHSIGRVLREAPEASASSGYNKRLIYVVMKRKSYLHSVRFLLPGYVINIWTLLDSQLSSSSPLTLAIALSYQLKQNCFAITCLLCNLLGQQLGGCCLQIRLAFICRILAVYVDGLGSGMAHYFDINWKRGPMC